LAIADCRSRIQSAVIRHPQSAFRNKSAIRNPQPAIRRVARPSSDAQENDPGFEAPGAYDDPERRPLGERCPR